MPGLPSVRTDAFPGRILVVDDAADTRLVVESVVERAGHQVVSVGTGREAIEMVRREPFDLVVLDLGLPDTDGLDVCRAMRSDAGAADLYIIILSGREAESERLAGLSAGADDYVVKPFSPAELSLRIEAMFRRPRGRSEGETGIDTGRVPAGCLLAGDMMLDRATHRFAIAGTEIPLTAIEFALMEKLLVDLGRVCSREQLAQAVWTDGWSRSDHLVNTHVSNLRKKVDADGGGRIVTVRGVGYRVDVATSGDIGPDGQVSRAGS